MTSLSISVTSVGVSEVVRALDSVAKNIRKEIGAATWETQRKGKRLIAQEVVKEINLPQKTVMKAIVGKRFGDGSATVSLSKERRLSLKHFKPKQNKAGVTVKINRNKATLIKGAFMGPRPGVLAMKLKGHVAVRSGSDRKPLRFPKGISPYGFIKKSGRVQPIGDQLQAVFLKELKDRLRYLKLKAAGGLNFQQPSYVSDQATGEN